jgi:hypothetical protein
VWHRLALGLKFAQSFSSYFLIALAPTCLVANQQISCRCDACGLSEFSTDLYVKVRHEASHLRPDRAQFCVNATASERSTMLSNGSRSELRSTNSFACARPSVRFHTGNYASACSPLGTLPLMERVDTRPACELLFSGSGKLRRLVQNRHRPGDRIARRGAQTFLTAAVAPESVQHWCLVV